jgi:hypothetical protein
VRTTNALSAPTAGRSVAKRVVGKAKRALSKHAPLMSAARADHRSQKFRKQIEAAHMSLLARQSSPDEVLDHIVEDAIGASGIGSQTTPSTRTRSLKLPSAKTR